MLTNRLLTGSRKSRGIITACPIFPIFAEKLNHHEFAESVAMTPKIFPSYLLISFPSKIVVKVHDHFMTKNTLLFLLGILSYY